MTLRRESTYLMLAVFGGGAAAALQTLIAYQVSPLAGLVVPLAIAAAALIAWRPILGVYMALLAIPFDGEQFEVGALAFTPAEIAVFATGAAALVHIAAARRRPRLHPAYGFFLGLILVSALGLTFSPEQDVLIRITGLWLALLLVSVHISTCPPREAETVLVCLALSGGIAGVLAVLGIEALEVHAGGEAISGRATSVFAHPNVLGVFLLMALAPAMVLSGRGSPGRRTLMLAASAAIVAGLVLTLTRGAVIGAVVSLLVLMTWPSFRRAALGVLVVLAAVVALNWDSLAESPQATVVQERFGTLTSAEKLGANPRVEIWSRTLSMVADRPLFGVGEGNYDEFSPRYGLLDIGALHYDHAHNIFLTIAAELGLVGLALFVAFVWSLARAAYRLLRRRDPRTYALALAASAALAGLLMNSLTEYPPRTSSIMATIMIEIGVLLALVRVHMDEAAAADTEPGTEVMPSPAGGPVQRFT